MDRFVHKEKSILRKKTASYCAGRKYRDDLKQRMRDMRCERILHKLTEKKIIGGTVRGTADTAKATAQLS
jgi:hypothetical protein